MNKQVNEQMNEMNKQVNELRARGNYYRDLYIRAMSKHHKNEIKRLYDLPVWGWVWYRGTSAQRPGGPWIVTEYGSLRAAVHDIRKRIDHVHAYSFAFTEPRQLPDVVEPEFNGEISFFASDEETPVLVKLWVLSKLYLVDGEVVRHWRNNHSVAVQVRDDGKQHEYRLCSRCVHFRPRNKDRHCRIEEDMHTKCLQHRVIAPIMACPAFVENPGAGL